MLFLIISSILLLSTFKIRTRKRIYKITFFFIKLFFFPFRILNYFFQQYLKNQNIQNKIDLKEKQKREKIEKRIAEIKNTLPTK